MGNCCSHDEQAARASAEDASRVNFEEDRAVAPPVPEDNERELMVNPSPAPPTETPLPSVMVRKEIRRMSREEQDRWARAVLGMMQNVDGKPESSEFFRIAGYHGWPSSYCEHAQETFPGWHRAYLCEFEQALRAADMACGNDGHIAMAYWDWLTDEINGEKYPQVLARHFSKMPADLVATDNQLKQQGYDSMPSEESIIAQIRRAGVTDMVYRAYENEEHYMAASKRWTGDSIESPHDSIHVASGFPMISVSYAAFHPLFWLHHCNVDRIYEKYLKSEPDSQTEMRNNQYRLSRKSNEPNRYLNSLAPFKHPVTGADFMPADVFDASALGYEYQDLPEDRQLSTRFPAIAVFYPIKPSPSTHMLHVFVVKKAEEAKWKSPPESDFTSGKVDSMPGYAGWGAAWGSKEVETCANCKKRLPYSVRVDTSLALSRLNLKPSQAALKVVCFDANYKMVPKPDAIPAPMLRGPFFEEVGSDAPSLKQGSSGADVKAVQEYLARYGYFKNTPDGKFGKSTKEAVVAFQKRFEMPQQDGVVTPSLKKFMLRPRCDGLHDSTKDKALYGPTPKIKVRVDACPGYLEQEAVNTEVRRACDQWEAACPVTFELLPGDSSAEHDLLITWGDHCEDNLFFFDGKGGKLAHAEKEVITLDNSEYWVLQGITPNPRRSQPVELLPIVLHELGHSLGLSHPGPGGAEDVMFSHYVPGRCALSQGDKDRIAKLYPRS